MSWQDPTPAAEPKESAQRDPEIGQTAWTIPTRSLVETAGAVRRGRALRILYVKDRFNWPRASGGDIHGSQMARALAERGHEVDVASLTASDPVAVRELGARRVLDLSQQQPCEEGIEPPSRLQRRFNRYLGIDPQHLLQLAGAVQGGGYDAVVVLGVNSIPLLRAVRGPLRIWHAADDAALLHWSMFKPRQRQTWKHLRLAAMQGLYERAHRRLVDRAWVVSPRDGRVMRVVAGFPAVDVVPNGVDSDFYRPLAADEQPHSCAFWGRLEFGPNEDAVDWIASRVWPIVRARCPTAKLTVMGFGPTDRVRRACAEDGIELLANVPDLRQTACERAVAVMPFVSGVGIKNKVLEAAAMARPMVCTPDATSGLKGAFPARVARSPQAFADAICQLFEQPETRLEIGRNSRTWVTREHGWASAAAEAETGLYHSLTRRIGGRPCRTN